MCFHKSVSTCCRNFIATGEKKSDLPHLEVHAQSVIQTPEVSQRILPCQKRKEQINCKSCVISINPIRLHQISQGPTGMVIEQNSSPRFTDDTDGSP